MQNLKINDNPADVGRTVSLIQDSAMLAMVQTEQIAQGISKVKGSENRARAIWQFLRSNYAYAEDPFGKEYIRMPELSWQDRKEGIDCEDFSIMAAAISVQLDFVADYRIIDYGDGPAHIYVIARSRTAAFIIDPTHSKFNQEYGHKWHKDYHFGKDPKTYGLGTSLPDQIRLVQLQLYIARKDLQIEGDRNGWFGRRTEADKKRIAKVEKFQDQLKSLKEKYYLGKGIGYGAYGMTATEIERQIELLRIRQKQYELGSNSYKKLGEQLAGYRTELKMRRDNNLGDTVPDTATMLKMRGLRGRRISEVVNWKSRMRSAKDPFSPYDPKNTSFRKALAELRNEGINIIYDSKNDRYVNLDMVSPSWGYPTDPKSLKLSKAQRIRIQKISKKYS